MLINFFDGDDARFLAEMEQELPGITQNFCDAAIIPPYARPQWAHMQTSHIYRDGWFVNTPVGVAGKAETVANHKDHLTCLIRDIFPSHLQVDACDIVMVHDDHEVIAHATIDGVRRDLNPKFNTQSYRITSDDKARLETMAAHILFKSASDKMETWYDYKDRQSEAAKAFDPLDKLCVMWKCVDYVESGRFKYSGFQRYWEYWPLKKVQDEMPKFIAEAYADTLQPRIDRLAMA